MVDFGGVCCRSCCSSSCDRGKTKSTPSPFDLDWNGLEFDKNKAEIFLCSHLRPPASVRLVKQVPDCLLVLPTRVHHELLLVLQLVRLPGILKIQQLLTISTLFIEYSI